MTDVDDHKEHLSKLMLETEALDALDALFHCDRRGICLMNMWLGSCSGMAKCMCRRKFSEWYVVKDDDEDLEELPF